MSLKPWQWAAIGGGLASLGVTAVGVYLKVQELGTPARRAQIEREVTQVAEAEADRYIGSAWGFTPQRIAALQRLIPR
jgi:hypothetical protein